MNEIPFTPAKIGTLEIKNRFIMSAAVDGLAANPETRSDRYAKLAEGGVGLIVAGRVLDRNEAFEKVVTAVHAHGGKIALQILSHMGLAFNPTIDAAAASVVPAHTPIFSPYFRYGPHHAASEAEIMDFIGDYAKAARLANEFGADAIQVHAAHDSALMQFLSPLINRRSDKWGGTIENRVRVHTEVYKAIRAEVGDRLPVFIKLGVADPYPGGLKFEEGKIAAQILAACGYDALEISQGLMDFGDAQNWSGTPIRRGIAGISGEAYFRAWCREIKKTIPKPTIMTGGIRSYELVREMLANGETDFIGMCRPFIMEPGLVKRWETGNRKKARCVSCGKCCLVLAKKLPLACHIGEKPDI